MTLLAQTALDALVVSGAARVSALPIPAVRQAKMQLDVLHGRDRQLTELRFRAGKGMHSEFFLDRVVAARRAIELSARTDVYVGVLPRTRRSGGKDSTTPHGRVLWAECDTDISLARAIQAPLPPHMIVRSSRGKGHAYWILHNPLPVELVEQANKRIAWALGADPVSTEAARVLRVAGTVNHKRADIEPVALTTFEHTRANHRDLSWLDALPDPPAKRRPIPASTVQARQWRVDAKRDGLLAIPSRRYIYALSGREVLGAMAQCPWHKGGQERTPSLHTGGPHDTLWYCHGCGEGGDVFDFAARLWGLNESRDFAVLKSRLAAALL